MAGLRYRGVATWAARLEANPVEMSPGLFTDQLGAAPSCQAEPVLRPAWVVVMSAVAHKIHGAVDHDVVRGHSEVVFIPAHIPRSSGAPTPRATYRPCHRPCPPFCASGGRDTVWVRRNCAI